MDQSVTNFYLKETNTLREELNKNKVLMKDLAETIKKFDKSTLKQHEQIQSQSFTADYDE